MRRFLFLVLLWPALPIAAQPDSEQLLAVQYYNKAEFDKAVVLFEKLYQKDPSSTTTYRYYLNCLMSLEDLVDAEKLVKKQIKRLPYDLTLQVDLGHIATVSGDAKKAARIFDDVIANLQSDKTTISQLATAFIAIGEFDRAEAVYEKGKRLLRHYDFSYERALLAQRMGDRETMVARYLDYLAFDPSQSDRVRTAVTDAMDDEAFIKSLTTQLYQRIQANPDDVIFTDMLAWLLIQKRDFAGALRQVKALDRRLREQGRRVHELATTLMNEKEYDVAAEAYTYIVEQGRNSAFYFYGREGLLRARKRKITESYTYTQDDISKLKSDYEKFIDEFGFNKAQAAPTLRELAQLEAFYIHNTARAIELLKDLVATPGITTRFLNECKLDLGDCYLLINDPWEATLLYSQVDLQMKDDPLGEEARYRNARWWYYQGDFLWSQSQLDVLKASTSELIANDALNLSVFITDNLGLDSTSVPMMMFARADLLIFQNKFAAAMHTLDSIETRFPNHSLQDDIYMLKSEMWLKQQNVDQCLAFLEKVIAGDSNSILIDDALFRLGDLYQHAKHDPDKAMIYYEKILLEQKGSIFVVEARNRFRALRGDKLN
jgi:tetratricopeptide (TPR) repeat protein